MIRSGWLALAFILAGRLGAIADPISVTAMPLGSFTPVPLVNTFGPLEWRGGLELSSPDKRFGGFSSLALSTDGTRLLAASDAGWWLTATLTYRDGDLSGLARAAIDPVLNDKGQRPPGKLRNDLEAIALARPGDLAGPIVAGFESLPRIGTYASIHSPFVPLPFPKDIAKGPRNRELEAIGRFSSGVFKGKTIAISELDLDANGDIRAWIFDGKTTLRFGIERYGDYAITDLALLPDGDILTLERSFGGVVLAGMAIRRIHTQEIVEAGAVTPELLFEATLPLYRIDNMEGIAVSEHDGETRVALISDDNYNHRLQRTLLLQFALKK